MGQIEIDKLDYSSKKELYNKIFSIGNFFSDDMNERFMLISLVSFTYKKMKEKNPSVTVLQILLNITKQKVDNSGYYQCLESIAILVEDFSYGVTKVDSCGFKSSQEIINKIKEILSSWVPF